LLISAFHVLGASAVRYVSFMPTSLPSHAESPPASRARRGILQGDIRRLVTFTFTIFVIVLSIVMHEVVFGG